MVDDEPDMSPRSPLAELLVHLREAVYGLSQVADVFASEMPQESLTSTGYETLQAGALRARQAVEQMHEWHQKYS
jgi:hypothetical protein